MPVNVNSCQATTAVRRPPAAVERRREATQHRGGARRAGARAERAALSSPVVASSSVHIHPTAPLAERALLPGDPGRALALAQALFDETPRMFNHNRGLWGYTGIATDGEPLTVQSTGLGGPSAAIVLEELCDLGLRRAIRVGTCSALGPAPRLGDTLAVHDALAADGTSRALVTEGRIAADPALAAELATGADHAGTVASADLFYDPREHAREAWRSAGAVVVDLQTAAVLAVARRRGITAGALLGVARDGADRLDERAAEAMALRMGRAALAALRPAAARS